MSEKTIEESATPRLPSRRSFLALGVGAFVVGALPRAVRPKRRLVRRQAPVMGTIADVAVVHRDPDWAHAAIGAALAELHRVDRTMTRYRDDSEIGRANLLAAHRSVSVSGETGRVLAAAIRWAEATNGAFDPCLGDAVELWDVEHRRRPPSAGETKRWAGRRLFGALELDRRGDAARVRFHDPDVALDLGGIAKGHGVDRAAAILQSWGIAHALVNVGGDLVVLGESPDGDPWEVGVRDPADSARLAATLEVSDRAIATSGDYERFFDHGRRRYHHILDPATGEPRRAETRSVTIAGPTCLEADAAGTAVFGAIPDDARRRLVRLAPDLEVVHTI